MIERVSREPLLDRIQAADLKRRIDKAAGSNRRVLLAHRVDIEAALAHGYSLRRLHAQLRDEDILSTDYSSFRRAARAAGIGASKVTANPLGPASPPVAVTPAEKTTPVWERPTGGPREFVHNARPDRKNILWGDDPVPDTTKPEA